MKMSSHSVKAFLRACRGYNSAFPTITRRYSVLAEARQEFNQDDLARNDKAMLLLNDSIVSSAIYKETGNNSKLISYTTENFMNLGDNHSSFVTGITAEYLDGQSSKYVAKLNPQKSSEIWAKILKSEFKQEGAFYNLIVPELNSLLEAQNQPNLNVPKLMHFDSIEGKEVMVFEDLREKGFDVPNRTYSLDKDHVKLILREYARIHAASRLLFAKHGSETLSKFKLNEHALSAQFYSRALLDQLENSVETAILVCGYLGPEYDLGRTCLKEFLPIIATECNFDCIGTSKFSSIIHHDCWNNYMFRYEGGQPAEVRILDWQFTRPSSIASDLNYFMHANADSSLRTYDCLEELLSEYMSAYASCLPDGASCDFTLEELKEEYLSKNVYGIVMAATTLPLLMPKHFEFPDADLNERVYNKMMAIKIFNNFHDSPELASRFKDIFQC